LIPVPVTDVARAKAFYSEQVGFKVDFDYPLTDGARFVQLTPPGSGCSLALGEWIVEMQPGDLRGVVLVVADLHQARAELVERGVEVTDFTSLTGGRFVHERRMNHSTWSDSSSSAIRTEIAGLCNRYPRVNQDMPKWTLPRQGDVGEANARLECERQAKMGKIVVSQFVTLDGVMEDPGGSEDFEHGGWAFQFERGADGDQFKVDEVFASEALLLGRVTYQGFAAAWPGRSDETGFADKFNNMPKYVASMTLSEPLEWNNSTLLKDDLADSISALREQPGGDVLVNGSCQLVQFLREHDLVDEYRLMVFPIVLGSGKKLFGEGRATIPLRLVEARPVGSDGVVILTYQPASRGAA
jgi:dihydrofolate reductase/predicted enzyme related to lactoylglutathione lyase